VVWCGVVWCGVVWCGVVWCGVVWCGVVWCAALWCAVLWCAALCCDWAVIWAAVIGLCCAALHYALWVLWVDCDWVAQRVGLQPLVFNHQKQLLTTKAHRITHPRPHLSSRLSAAGSSLAPRCRCVRVVHCPRTARAVHRALSAACLPVPRVDAKSTPPPHPNPKPQTPNPKPHPKPNPRTMWVTSTH